MKPVTVGLTVLAGAALLEAALVPGVVIGAAAVLTPKLLPKILPKLLPRILGKRRRPAPAPLRRSATAAPMSTTRLAIFKTISFRVIATSLDFTSNIIVIGALAPAATLSAYGLIAGPLFYFGHELLWQRRDHGQTTVELAGLPRLRPGAEPPLSSRTGLKLDRILVKTVTYRAIVTTTDFTANFVVSGDLAQAVTLTAFGFVVGPFVYYGHEKAWERFGPRAALPGGPVPVLTTVAKAVAS